MTSSLSNWSKTIAVVFYFTMLLSLSSCVTLYKPNAIHSPLIKEKGETSATVMLGLSGCGYFNGQIAYAQSEHFGIMADGMYHSRSLTFGDNTNNGTEKLHIFSGEGGAGYFTKFGDKQEGLFQCYGGGGYGKATNKVVGVSGPTPEANANYYNLFVQPGIAYFSNNTVISFDMRANYVQLYNINAYLYNQFEWWNTDFKFHNDTTINFINLEPTITFKAGSEKAKAIIQLGATVPVYHSDSYLLVNNYSLFTLPLIKFTVGVNINIGKKKTTVAK